MTPFQLRIPPHVSEIIAHLPPRAKRDVKQALRALAGDPHAGEPLQRELAGCWKYRVRSLRIVYRLAPESRALHILAIGHRATVYDLVRRQQK